jgi:release factor glutamine methyltransferase
VTDRSVEAAAWTVGEAIARGSAKLSGARSPTPRLDAELLVGHAFGRDRAWLMAHPEAPLDPATWWALSTWIERRARGEPIAYIRGYKEWLSLRISADRRALIPRPETELLAEAAIGEVASRLTRDGEPVVVWEVATGSGAVALALALRFRSALRLGRLRLIASDLSPDALELAAENLSVQGVSELVTLACSDLLEASGSSLPRPGVVVANLPYLTTEEVDRAPGSIAFEPRMALDGGADGLDVVRALLDQLRAHAEPDAVTLLEIGVGQADGVRALAPEGAAVSTLADLAGIERIVRIELEE